MSDRIPRRALAWVGVAALVLLATVLLRGEAIANLGYLNPDEAELMAMGRAATYSPTPFSTWTMGTTGPVWPWFLAILGVAGLPLTLAFAHLLSAVLAAVFGLLAIVLLRRSLGGLEGAVVGGICWLALTLAYPLGGLGDFAALSTEYLPVILLLAAALIRVEHLTNRAWLWLILGLLAGLAIAAKYQALPIGMALVIARLIEARVDLRRFALYGSLAAGGALVPVVVVIVMALVDPRFSPELFGQSIGFLGSYAEAVPFSERLLDTAKMLLRQPLFSAAVLVIVLAALRSTRITNVARLVLAAMSVLSALLGGKAFDHYLILVYGGLVLAASLPLKPGERLFRAPALRKALLGVGAGVAVIAVVVGLVTGRVSVQEPSRYAAALSHDSVITDPVVAAACPEGSRVVVWGWAAELYLSYSWQNAVPFMNTYGLALSPAQREAAAPLVRDALATADCVVDAVGPPFFFVNEGGSITATYPWSAALLEQRYRLVDDAFDCEVCRLYAAE